MSGKEDAVVAKDEKQLKKERKERERQQKEKEKQEKKREKEKRKQEEKERKQREKEKKAQGGESAGASAKSKPEPAAKETIKTPPQAANEAENTADTSAEPQAPVPTTVEDTSKGGAATVSNETENTADASAEPQATTVEDVSKGGPATEEENTAVNSGESQAPVVTTAPVTDDASKGGPTEEVGNKADSSVVSQPPGEAGGATKDEVENKADSSAELQAPTLPDEDANKGGPTASNEAESTADSNVQPQAPVKDTTKSGATVSNSWPDKVTVAKPPGQITNTGQPIGIVFDATQAGEGTVTASCTGARVGNTPTTVTKLKEGIFNVEFTPYESDVYTLSVKLGGKGINGSPFNINLNRLSPPRQKKPEVQEPEAKKEETVSGSVGTTEGTEEGKEEEEEAYPFVVSDDPFDMAFQASRLLEEQQRRAQSSATSSIKSTHTSPPKTSTASPPKTSSATPPAKRPGHSQQSNQSPNRSLPPTLPTASKGSPSMAHPPSTAASGTQRSKNTASLPYPSDPLLSSMPTPRGFPAREEEVRYLQEVNKSLQHTNEGLGEEVADLKKKMGEFEAKLSTIEQSSRQSEDERKELATHSNIRGWLYKRGIKGPTANVWRQRYFRCDNGSKIYYYRAEDDSMPRGCLDVDQMESVEEVTEPQPDPNNRASFHIRCSGRSYQLQAEDEATRKMWITSIEYLRNWRKKNSLVPSPKKPS